MAYQAPGKLEGLTGGAERALLAELRKLQEELAELRAARQEVLDRRRDTTIRPRVNELVRAVAGSTVVLPHPRPSRGQAVGVLVESQPVTVLAPSGTVNDAAELVVTTLGLMVFRSTGDEWWGTAAGGSTGGGMPDVGDQRVLGNDSGATAAPTDTTVHQVLDWVGGTARWVFDGVDDRIDFGDVLSKERTDAFSMSLWFRTTSTTGAVMMGKNLSAGSTRRGYTLNIGASALSWALANDSNAGANLCHVSVAASINDGSWHQVIVTYDGSSDASGVAMYIDGASVSLSVVTNNLSATTVSAAAYTLGARDGTNSAPFAGTLAHAAMWNRELTAAEAAEIYGAGVPPDLLAVSCASALEHWAALDELDTAVLVDDRSASALDGTPEGGLAPTGAEGALIGRGSAVWELIEPSTTGHALCSNGVNTLPSFQAVANAGLATMAANTVKANATASSAVPTDFAVGTNTVLGRVAGNIVAAQLATGQCANDAITDAKLRNSAALSVIGRSANSTGDPADIAAGTDGHVLRRSGTTLGFGTIATAGIADDAVTNAKLRNSGALSVIGRSANSAGDPADISATAASDAVLRESGSVLAFGTVATGGIADDAVTNAKLANMAQATVKLRASGAGTGDPTDGTADEVLDMLATPRAGNIIVHNGVSWVVVDELLTEEFWTNTAGTSGNDFGQWNWYQPNGVTTTHSDNRVPGHPGVVLQTTGSGALSIALAQTSSEGGTGDRGEILGEDIAFFRVIVRITNPDSVANPLLDARFGIGLAFYDESDEDAQFAGNIPNMGGYGIALFKRANNTEWDARFENNSSVSQTDTGVTVAADTWYEAVFIQTSVGTWNVYINGVLRNTGQTDGPQGVGMVPIFWCDDAHVSETRYWQIDLIQIGLRFTNPRYD